MNFFIVTILIFILWIALFFLTPLGLGLINFVDKLSMNAIWMTIFISITISLWILSIWLGGWLAQKKGYEKAHWRKLCGFFTFFGVLYLFFLPDKNLKK